MWRNWKPLHRVGNIKPYKYQPFPEEDCIRILKLYPGKIHDKIKCRLKIVPLEEAVGMYEAISYVWGESSVMVDVICSGRKLIITDNLSAALQRIRDPKKPKLLWADAICINQEDEEEKGHQVKRMGKVYENARRVFVWLGHDTGGIAEDCFELIRSINRYLDAQMGLYGSDTAIPRLIKPFKFDTDKSRWDKVWELVHLPWFSRVWVVQEAGLARECVLLWGRHQLEIADLLELAFWGGYREDFRSAVGYIGTGLTGEVFRSVQCRYKNAITWRKSRPLIAYLSGLLESEEALFVGVLAVGRRLQASDLRDHVYAFLGSPLALKEDGMLLIEPDYKRTANEIYLDVALALLKHPREAPWTLSHVFHQSSEDVLAQDLPSWAPRWEKLPPGRHRSVIGNPVKQFRAGGSGREFQPSIEGGKVLSVSVIRFDSLSWISKPICNSNLRSNLSGWDNEVLSAGKPFIDIIWEDLLCSASCAVDRLELEFSLTMVMGYCLPNERVKLEKHRRDFEAYRRLFRKLANPDQPQKSEIPSSQAEEDDSTNIMFQFRYIHDLRLCYTKDGRLGLVPLFAQPNDICCILPGVSVPFILRTNGRGTYHLVGECYIHGVMQGELMTVNPDDKFLEETIMIE